MRCLGPPPLLIGLRAHDETGVPARIRIGISWVWTKRHCQLGHGDTKCWAKVADPLHRSLGRKRHRGIQEMISPRLALGFPGSRPGDLSIDRRDRSAAGSARLLRARRSFSYYLLALSSVFKDLVLQGRHTGVEPALEHSQCSVLPLHQCRHAYFLLHQTKGPVFRPAPESL